MAQTVKKRILDKKDVSEIEPNLSYLKILPRSLAEKAEAIVFDIDKKSLCILTTNNYPKLVDQIIDKFEAKGYKHEFFYTDDETLKIAVAWYDRLEAKEQKIQDEIDERESVTGDSAVVIMKDVYEKKEKLSEGAFIEELIKLAFKAGSSDLHFQAEEIGMVIRIRKDGILKTVLVFEHQEFRKYLVKLKFMSGAKINVNYVPQDGRFDFTVQRDGQTIKIDVRVNFMPGLRSENIVMRFLDSSKGILTFEQIGFMGDSLDLLRKNLAIPYGMILMTGPTGSGKTTTLYSMLNYINSPGKKIITLEDPVEYELSGIQQSQINYSKGYKYEDGLKAILRQDPDIIMVGEIRTLETAEIAINAALTGHLVISTLHTNTAIEAISRMLNMGVKPYLLASALNLLIGQRLVRRLCTCHRKRNASGGEDQEVKAAIKTINQINPRLKINYDNKVPLLVGCDKCGGDGYKGRIAALETFNLNDSIKDSILKDKSTLDIYSTARQNGFLNMKEDSFLKMLKGFTTLEEIRRVL